jgi:protein tyrosine/serine phosphatase
MTGNAMAIEPIHPARRLPPAVLRAAAWIVAGAATFVATDRVLNVTRKANLPKNFAVVRPGVLYRSGQLRREHLEQVVREHGIRTVISLNGNETVEERDWCRRLGVRRFAFEMPGDGLGAPKDFHRTLQIVADPARQPVLVHCAAGSYRTGVAVAAYRAVLEGWTPEDAIAEMAYCRCRIVGDYPLQAHVRQVIATTPRDLFAGHRPREVILAPITERNSPTNAHR